MDFCSILSSRVLLFLLHHSITNSHWPDLDSTKSQDGVSLFQHPLCYRIRSDVLEGLAPSQVRMNMKSAVNVKKTKLDRCKLMAVLVSASSRFKHNVPSHPPGGRTERGPFCQRAAPLVQGKQVQGWPFLCQVRSMPISVFIIIRPRKSCAATNKHCLQLACGLSHVASLACWPPQSPGKP